MVTNTTIDVTNLYTQIAGVVAGSQSGDLVLVVGEVHANLPTQVLLLNGNDIHGNLNTLVLHITNILQQIVGQVGTGSNGHLVEQIVGFTLIDIYATVDAVFQETEVKTYIVSCCLLPLNLCSISFRCDRNDCAVAKPIVRTSLVGVVGGNRRIVTLIDVLLTGDTPSETEFQV